MSVTTAKGGPGYVSRNYAMNGDFEVNQREFSLLGGAVTSKLVDRYYGNFSGAGGNFSLQSFASGELVVPGYGEASQYIRVTCNATPNDNMSIGHAIPEPRRLAGQTITISAWARSSDATDLAFEIQLTTVSGTQAIHTTRFTPTSNWTRYSATFTAPDMTGLTLDNFSRWRIFLVNKNAELFTADWWGLQVEIGSVATPFKLSHQTAAAELRACQEYYYRIGGVDNVALSGGYVTTGSDVRATIQFPVKMRRAPDFSVINETNGFAIYDGSASVTTFADVRVGTGNSRDNLEVLWDTDAASFTVGRAAQIKTSNIGSPGIIDFDADLL